MLIERYLFFMILIVSGGSTGSLAVTARKQNQTPVGKVFCLLLWSITCYSWGYAGELISDTLPRMLFWSNFQYFGIVLLPPLWIILALLYNGLEKWLTRPLLIGLFLIPSLTLVIHFTNCGHLYYAHPAIDTQGPFPTFAPQLGPWYWVTVVYQNLALLMGTLLFIIMGRHENVLYQRQLSLILLAVTLPWIGHLITLSGFNPWGLDLTPLALTLTALITYWGFNNWSLFDIVPIARTKVFESIANGVLVLDLQNRVVDFNTAVKRMLNLPATCFGLKIEQIISAYPQLLQQLSCRAEMATIQIKDDETPRYLESKLHLISDSFHRVIGYTVILTDKSEQHLLLKELQTLATIDSLTNVFNRRYFFEKCRQEIDRLQSLKLPVSFLLIDLDHFKEINDTYGHQNGDAVLRQASTILREVLLAQGASHLLGRVGGEEFAVLLPECPVSKAYAIAEQLRSSLSSAVTILTVMPGAADAKPDENNPHNEQIISAQTHNFTPPAQNLLKIANVQCPTSDKQIPVPTHLSIPLTASFGVSGSSNSSEKLDLLFSQADAALYRSKAKGRNAVTIFSPR
jgi:diguanylate cyclase (GGDEF)-like protein